MALLPIIEAPDRRLKVRSEPVAQVDDEVRRLLDDMVETMRAAPGVGLSAVQVGVAQRIIVTETSDKPEEGAAPKPPTTLYLVNPEITWTSERLVICEEGCLSLPDQFADLERPAEVRVRYLDRDGAGQEVTADGVLARCLLHEMDHLEGILLVDRLSPVRRHMILRKLVKARKKQPAVA